MCDGRGMLVTLSDDDERCLVAGRGNGGRERVVVDNEKVEEKASRVEKKKGHLKGGTRLSISALSFFAVGCPTTTQSHNVKNESHSELPLEDSEKVCCVLSTL